MGVLLGIAYRDEQKGPMKELATASINLEHGVHTDTRGKKKNHRQVTVLSKKGWDAACESLKANPVWTTRRANLFIEGVDLRNTTGSTLVIGDVELEITGELEPCKRMDEQVPGLTEALVPDWRGGVTCRLVKEGTVKVGHKVTLA